MAPVTNNNFYLLSATKGAKIMLIVSDQQAIIIPGSANSVTDFPTITGQVSGGYPGPGFAVNVLCAWVVIRNQAGTAARGNISGALVDANFPIVRNTLTVKFWSQLAPADGGFEVDYSVYAIVVMPD